MLSRTSLLALIVCIGISQTQAAEKKSAILKPSAEGISFFEKKIRPVLVNQCYRCHSQEAEKAKGGLMVDTREGLHKGGDSGPALIRGNPKNSLIISALRYQNDLEMPPSKKLPDTVINDFEKWISMGAPDPRSTEMAEKKTFTPATDLWCLKSIAEPQPPIVNNTSWPRVEIDRFILAKLEKANLNPVGDAKPLALLRRLYFDLIGLPPKPEDIKKFQQSAAKDTQTAIVEVVDSLLQSPRFGERWGRHWLDVARFAESNGQARDMLYPHAWRYRRYVIDSFNADKPYDEFVREQVAGDLLPAKDVKEKTEHLIATGFLALGPKPLMKRGEQFNMDVIDDQIDATSRAFLALTVSCARCHDHKFDPIPTKDYYSMGSIFRSTKTLYGSFRNKNSGAGLLPLPSGKNEKEKPKVIVKAPNRAEIQQQLRATRTQLKKLQAAKANNPKKKQQIQALNTRIKRLQAQLRNANARRGGAQGPKGPVAMAVQEENTPQDLRVLVRGEIGKFGSPAPRGFLSAVKLDQSIKVNPKQSGRLELAQWLTDSSNPLTARVMVNRVWHHLFGRGFVRTVDNFGSNGEEPTHPALLDYLSQSFIKEGYSVKKLIRQIVLSRTYQLGAFYNEANYQHDPDNTLVWRHTLRRLDVEAIRDAMLQASGKLDLTPPKRSRVAEIGGGEVGRGINEEPLHREHNHRSVYLPVLRGWLPEILKVFDFAEPSLVVGNRNITTVPAQALFMMNSPFVIENAKRLAADLLKQPSEELAITVAYQRCLSRAPSVEEKQKVSSFLAQCLENVKSKENDEEQQRLFAWTGFCQALLAGAEFRYLN